MLRPQTWLFSVKTAMTTSDIAKMGFTNIVSKEAALDKVDRSCRFSWMRIDGGVKERLTC